jgi:cell wall-associated NlpC family hydrolase
MSEATERAAVVAAATSFVGTPYRHMGRAKGSGGGVDCAQLVWCVFHECGLTPDMPLEPYPPDFMLHQGVERYMKIVLDRAHEIPETRTKPGDVVLYRVGRLFAHGGIIVDPGWPHIVHAWADARMVIADKGDKHRLARRPRKFFSRWSQPALEFVTPTLLARDGLAGGDPREE